MSQINNIIELTKEEKFDKRKLSRKQKSHTNKEVSLEQLQKLMVNNENATIVTYVEAQGFGNYEKVFNQTILDKRLSGNALKVLLILCLYHNTNPQYKKLTKEEITKGVSYPSQDRIAKDAGMSINTVNNSIKKLIELGYLTVKNENNSASSSNRYIINLVVDKRYSPQERNVEENIKNFSSENDDIELPF